jgi:hypothetical protein
MDAKKDFLMPVIETRDSGKTLYAKRETRPYLREHSSSWKRSAFFKQLIAEAQSTSQFLQVEKCYQDLCESLDSCSNLAANWNSYDAERPSPTTIKAVARFLRKLRTELFMPNRVIPSAEGGIAVYFTRGDKTAYLEYRNSGESILAMYDNLGDPLVVELTESDADESRAITEIREYVTA